MNWMGQRSSVPDGGFFYLGLMMCCSACSGWRPGCVGGTSGTLSWLEAAVSLAGGVLCLPKPGGLSSWVWACLPSVPSLLLCLCLYLYSRLLVTCIKEGSMADGQLSQCCDRCCCCTRLRLVPGCEAGLNTFLILAPPTARVQEETNRKAPCEGLGGWVALVKEPEQQRAL